MNRQSAGNENILEIYKKCNESILETANYFNIPYGTMWARLKKAGLKSKKKKPVYSTGLNETYFYNIDSATKAYFLGFIKADGYIDKKRDRLAIRIQERDVEILKRFCDALNLSIKRINIIKTQENQSAHVEVAITNKLFVKPILEIKSPEFLKYIPEEFIYDFIRGYFDGDGGVYYHNIDKKSFSMNIMGSPNDDSVLQLILKYFPNLKLYLDKRSNLPLLQTNNRKELINFRDLIYNDCFLYLTRKKEKFDRIKFWLTEPQRLHVKQPNE
jgi:hypothetical protein